MNHIQALPRDQRRAAAKYLAEKNKLYPAHLVPMDLEDSPRGPGSPFEAWRSREYLVQVFQDHAPGVVARLSINRTRLAPDGGWAQDIPWEDMQRLKREAGFGGFDAVEVYPSDGNVVNVANMRHLWVLEKQLPFAWRKR